MPTLFLMCGLPGAGKTTRAREIERECDAVRFTPDEWIAQLRIDPFDEERRAQLEQLHAELAVKLLSGGVDVILDFGFWSKQERDEHRSRAASVGAETEIVFLDVSREELLARLSRRFEEATFGEFEVTPQQLDEYMKLFQPPTAGELEKTLNNDENTRHSP